MWPGLVGKGPDSEPPIDLDTMLDLTAARASTACDSTALTCSSSLPHTDIDSSDDDLAALAEKLASKGLRAGSLVAPVWASHGRWLVDGQRRGARAISDSGEEGLPHRKQAAQSQDPQLWSSANRFGCRRNGLGERPGGQHQTIAETFREACDIAEGFGERLAAEGEICWGGMHSWRRNLQLLEMVDRPKTLGFQADMAHTMLFTMGYNAPEDRLLPDDFDWRETEQAARGLCQDGRRTAPVDHRFPCGAERRHSQRRRLAR